MCDKYNIHRFLILFIAILSCALQLPGQSYENEGLLFRYEGRGQCDYSYIFPILTNEYVDSLVIDKSNIVYDSPEFKYFNSLEIKERLTPLLNEHIAYRNPINKFSSPPYEFIPLGTHLRSLYTFSSQSENDFYLLRYQSFKESMSDNAYLVYFAGYSRKSDSLLILSEVEQGMLKNNFNYFISDCPSLSNMKPLCSAAILLSIIYEDYIIFLDSYNDIPFADIISRNKKWFYIPFDLASPYDLYLFDPMETYEISDKSGFLRIEESSYKEILMDTLKIKMKFHPPNVGYSQNEDTLSVIIYAPKYYEIAEWIIKFEKGGFIKSFEYRAPPYFIFTTNKHNSPYQYYGKQ